jgi:hypothetical protein
VKTWFQCLLFQIQLVPLHRGTSTFDGYSVAHATLARLALGRAGAFHHVIIVRQNTVQLLTARCNQSGILCNQSQSDTPGVTTLALGVGCRLMFATHYHALSREFAMSPRQGWHFSPRYYCASKHGSIDDTRTRYGPCKQSDTPGE